MKCKRCHKLIKENTEGNKRYCQGHDIFEKYQGDEGQDRKNYTDTQDRENYIIEEEE